MDKCFLREERKVNRETKAPGAVGPTWARPPLQQNKVKINNEGQLKEKDKRAIRTIIELNTQSQVFVKE